MAKKDTEKHYKNEDLLFLMLELIDFPNGNRKIFKFQNIKKLKNEQTTPSEVIKFIAQLDSQFDDLTFDNFLFIPDSEGETIRTLERTFDECDSFIRCIPSWPAGASYKKILSQKFEFTDLEIIMRAPIFLNRERILGWANFSINVGDKFRTQAIRNLKNYIALFENSQLKHEYRENNYYTFENHKLHGFKKIKEIADESDAEILLKDCYFGEKYHFLEFILFLHFYHYLDLKKIELDKKLCYSAETTIKKKLFNEEKRDNKKSEKKIITPLSLSTDTAWEDIKIQFIDEREIEIWVKKSRIGNFSFADLGCVNLKNKEPDKQWQMLLKMSTSKGEFDLNSFTAMKVRECYRQQKMSLSKKFEIFFGLKDPFLNYSEERKYKSRFKLVPIPILRGDGRIPDYRKDIKYGDLKAFYNDRNL